MNFYKEDNKTALASQEHAQFIVYGPMVFQAARVLRDSGILALVESKREEGITEKEIADAVELPLYGVRVLMEAGLGIGLFILCDDRYQATKTGYFILHDELTRANMDFVQDVCYQGMFHLEESIKLGRPEGLRVFGKWNTIYEGLSQLPPKVQKSWFGFDHYYSDRAFPEVMPHIFASQPHTVLDIGGNTGKWAIECAKYDAEVKITIMDLPGQLAVAQNEVSKAGFNDRISFFEGDLLKNDQAVPEGFDMVWMSQFLDCFSEEQIISILRRCHGVVNEKGCIMILEPFWDRQRFAASAFAMQQTSLYFTAIANGNSQMYHSKNFFRCVNEAGFNITKQVDLGLSHTLMTCQSAG